MEGVQPIFEQTSALWRLGHFGEQRGIRSDLFRRLTDDSALRNCFQSLYATPLFGHARGQVNRASI
jgi:hypothetical protein